MEIDDQKKFVDHIRPYGYGFLMKNVAEIFKALADETRLRILALLLEGELCVCEIIAALEMPQSTISRHLAYLRNRDWVVDRREGVWMYYCLNDAEQLMRELNVVLANHLTGDPGYQDALVRLREFRQEQQQKVC